MMLSIIFNNGSKYCRNTFQLQCRLYPFDIKCTIYKSDITAKDFFDVFAQSEYVKFVNNDYFLDVGERRGAIGH